jgi:hypothetical protein
MTCFTKLKKPIPPRCIRLFLCLFLISPVLLFSSCSTASQSKDADFKELVEDNGEAIGDAFRRAIDTKQITYAEALNLQKRLFSDSADFKDIVFLGAICSLEDLKVCDGLIVELAASENPLEMLSLARQLVIGEAETGRRLVVVTENGDQIYFDPSTSVRSGNEVTTEVLMNYGYPDPFNGAWSSVQTTRFECVSKKFQVMNDKFLEKKMGEGRVIQSADWPMPTLDAPLGSSWRMILDLVC